MVGAITYLLEKNGWKAGDKNVAFQACDDATAQAAKWDPGKCSQNANAYAQNPSLVAVLGTFNSGCAAIEIPVLNQAPGGGMLLLSAANTYGCLTEPCEGDEPEKYYPSGERTYARVAPSDPNQGAIQAQFAQENGIESVYILNDKEAYGLGVAKNFQGAAEFLGIEVKGFAAYDPTASNFEATFTKIKGTNPDAVFVGGLVDENSGQLIEDKVAVLGPNDGDVKLLLPDGFYTSAIFDPGEGGTPEANGAFFSVAGAPIEDFTGKGASSPRSSVRRSEGCDRPVRHLRRAVGGHSPQCDRELGREPSGAIIDEVFNTTVEDGYTGTFEINENGDVANAGGAVVTFVSGGGERRTQDRSDDDARARRRGRGAAGRGGPLGRSEAVWGGPGLSPQLF